MITLHVNLGTKEEKEKNRIAIIEMRVMRTEDKLVSSMDGKLEILKMATIALKSLKRVTKITATNLNKKLS